MDNTSKIQQVPKLSSDQLLKKFSDSGDDSGTAKKRLQASLKRLKRGRRIGEDENCESPTNSYLVERKSLLVLETRKSSTAIRTKLRPRNFKNKSFLGTIEKTWRRTIEGASKVLIEKHYYNRHKRLINDIV